MVTAEKLAQVIKPEMFICPSCGEPMYIIARFSNTDTSAYSWRFTGYKRELHSKHVDGADNLPLYWHPNCNHSFKSKELDEILLLEDLSEGY